MQERRKWNFGDWINERLQESPHEQFRKNKWKFWFITVAGFALINAGLTAAVFNTGGQLQQYLGAVLLGVGALVAWLCVAGLHYSDGPDRGLARNVALLDSAALVFVVIHFGFLVWIYGHLITLQSAERDYMAQAEKFNVEARQVQDGNVKIAEAAQAIAKETTKAEKLRNDTAYQQRKAAEAGGRILRSAPAVTVAPGLTTSTVELERPTKPTESSAAFLTRWDALIRIANICELLLAIATLIVIRNRSAKTNAPVEKTPNMFGSFSTVRAPAPVGNLTTKKEPAKNHGSFNSEGLKILRDVLRDISFRLHKRSFKSAVRGDAVWVYLMRANNGTQEAESSAKAKLSLLDDAMAMEREAFRERLERFLKSNGFEI